MLTCAGAGRQAGRLGDCSSSPWGKSQPPYGFTWICYWAGASPSSLQRPKSGLRGPGTGGWDLGYLLDPGFTLPWMAPSTGQASPCSILPHPSPTLRSSCAGQAQPVWEQLPSTAEPAVLPVLAQHFSGWCKPLWLLATAATGERTPSHTGHWAP